MFKTYQNSCCANHRIIIRGLFTKQRNKKWWRKHNDCPCTEYK